jgi:STE24 endopeptidase
VILGAILFSSLLALIQYAGAYWWILVWVVLSTFQLLINIIYPTFIAPFFNKFSALEDQGLQEKIEELSRQVNLDVKGIFQMDAMKRTKHSNAYFTGIGKTKRIVLYDTLIQSHSHDEILAVLVHEIGHMKKNHIKKQIMLTSFMSLVLLFAASKFLNWQLMYQSFGFELMPAYVGLFLLGLLWEPFGFVFSPIGMLFSRRYEKEADSFVFSTLQTTVPLISALKRLAKDNLSNLRPHPFFVWFNYSHPPLLNRIEYLEDMNKK